MPADARRFRKQLIDWFHSHRRDLPWRRTGNPYHIWISEVMLQQTQVATVVPYYERFVGRFPDVHSLASAPLDDVLKHWEKMGYYARARNLHKAAQIVVDAHGGILPADYDALRALPGIGDYIAAALSSIAFALPHAVVDGNVKRVLARVDTIDVPFNRPVASKVFRGAADELLDRERPGDFNQAMMELGATVCRPRTPLCPECPVASCCEAFATGRQGELPVRDKKKAVPHYHIAVGIVHREGRVLITRRPDEGLLGGLWEFPGGKVQPGESAADACRREIREEVNLDVDVTDHLTRVEHAYTHFRIGVDVFACTYTAGDLKLHGPVDYRWVVSEELDNYAFPGANHKFLPVVKKRLKSP